MMSVAVDESGSVAHLQDWFWRRFPPDFPTLGLETSPSRGPTLLS